MFVVTQSASILKLRKTKSVEVFLMGGLGNQLFCYSAGLYLSRKLQVDLKLRRNRLPLTNRNHPGRDISALNLPGQFMRQPVLSSNLLLAIINSPKRALRLISKIIRMNRAPNRNFYSNKIGADSAFEALSQPVVLDGYFQTWKYPSSIKDILCETIINYPPRTDYSKLIIEEIKMTKPIVVHVRRGDFNNSENYYFGMLSRDYYLRGYTLIKEYLNTDVPVWVFSDDPTVAKIFLQEIFPANTKWIEADDDFDALESLVAMTYGSAHIIANSTYSWWSAFLSANSKIVVAPNKWFEKKDDPPEILDPSWIAIESSWLE